jgi:1-acyl-sn-glycerol-3-phosphate acyltransferase
LPFHANLLQAAIAVNAPVQPVALKFVDAQSLKHSLAPCYGDDDTLLSSVWRTLCAPPLLAEVHYGPTEQHLGRSRREWAQDLRSRVAELAQ